MKKMKVAMIAVSIMGMAIIQGCTTHLTEGQKQELSVYESKGLVVKDKSPGAAATLGILPSVGYFYTGHPVLAVTTIPLYPFFGFLWMPADNYQAALSNNYYATKAMVERKRAAELEVIDAQLSKKEINYEQHLRKQREIEKKYSGFN